MSKLTIIFTAVILYSCTNVDTPNDKTELVVNAEINSVVPSKFKTVMVNESLQPYVDSLVEFDTIFDEAFGYGGGKHTVYTWFEKLMEIAQDDELVTLTKHSSPTIRGYSFWALVERENPMVKEIILEHVDDSVYVDRMSGCIGYQEKLNEFFLSIVAPNCINVDCAKLPLEDIEEIKAKMK